ncbi:MAG: tetratricopeptide repeat protein, partial [Syntrophobacterales bacterium]
AYLALAATAGWSHDAMDFYDRGLKSSLANKRIEYFSKAIELNPNLAKAYEKRAIHYYYQRKYDKAINDYSKLIELEPLEADAHRMRGMTYLRKQKGGWIKAEIDSLRSYFSKQGLPRSGELLEKAIEDFSQAIELDPKLASAYSYRAETYRLMGMTKEALRDSKVAINLGGDSLSIASAHATRAKIYGQRGQRELSEAEFNRAMELNPRFYVFGFFVLRYSDNMPSLDAVQRVGLLGIIAVAFVLIFRVTLRAPRKEE